VPHPTCQTIHSTLGGIDPKRSLISNNIELTCSDEEVSGVTPAKGDTMIQYTQTDRKETQTTHQLFIFINSKKVSAHSSYRLKPSSVQASSKASCTPKSVLSYFFQNENCEAAYQCIRLRKCFRPIGR
jgi:hypothetical protein